MVVEWNIDPKKTKDLKEADGLPVYICQNVVHVVLHLSGINGQFHAPIVHIWKGIKMTPHKPRHDEWKKNPNFNTDQDKERFEGKS